MKFRALKGIANNICATSAGAAFIFVHLPKNEMPAVGSWQINLLTGEAKTEKGNHLELTFSKEYQEWFLKEIAKASIPPEKIDLAELLFDFNIPKTKIISCTCAILANGRKHTGKSKIEMFL